MTRRSKKIEQNIIWILDKWSLPVSWVGVLSSQQQPWLLFPWDWWHQKVIILSSGWIFCKWQPLNANCIRKRAKYCTEAVQAKYSPVPVLESEGQDSCNHQGLEGRCSSNVFKVWWCYSYLGCGNLLFLWIINFEAPRYTYIKVHSEFTGGPFKLFI